VVQARLPIPALVMDAVAPRERQTVWRAVRLWRIEAQDWFMDSAGRLASVAQRFAGGKSRRPRRAPPTAVRIGHPTVR
jgi:hypothetical protein